MSDKDKNGQVDDYDLDDTINRQMTTSGVTGIVRVLREHAGDYPAEAEQAEKDES
ncbi:hypothetical protein [Lentisalinibacter salinarum]|uniref:hypothetical protein n=1 Tax=Lentisalinibacter salinarum TaxID=2992239 RepID=UPI0038659D1F